MDRLAQLQALVGNWTGTNQLWFPPATTPLASPSTVTVAPVVAGKFVQFTYTWVYEDIQQEGLLLVGYESGNDQATMVFADSWHMNEAVLLCRGIFQADGAINVRGSYGAEGGPDWGWRIVVEPGADTFRLAMYNIEPSGTEHIAVEVHYVRTEKAPELSWAS